MTTPVIPKPSPLAAMRAMLQLLPQDRVTRIVTHHRPHLDEILAIFILKVFGRKTFPGIETAKIEFWGHGQHTPDGRPIEEHLREGTLPIGVGNGPFDEHQEGARHKCAATLVAEYLGVRDDPRLTRLLGYTLRDDRQGSGDLFTLATMIKTLGQSFENDEVVRLGMKYVTAHFANRDRFFTTVAAAYQKVARVVTVPGPRGTVLVVVIQVPKATSAEKEKIYSQLARFAMSKLGGEADLVVQQTAGGNVQIFLNVRKRTGINLDEIARAIRFREQVARKKAGKGEVQTWRWDDLDAQGMVAGAECWYYLKKTWTDRHGHHQEMGVMLLNGSLTATDIEPTALALGSIVQNVKLVIDPNQWMFDEQVCRTSARCQPPDGRTCPWYCWGLARCRKVRYNARQAREATGNNRGHQRPTNGRREQRPNSGPLRASVEEVARHR